MFKQYRPIEQNEFIVCAVDTASGGLDYTAAQFLSKTRVDVPLVYHSRTTTSDFIPTLSAVLNSIYDTTKIKSVVALERQNGGSFLIDRLAGINYANKYNIFKMPTYGNIEIPDSTKLGWDTNSATRPKMLQDLKDAIDKKVIRIYDESTVSELYSFIIAQTSSSWKAQAERGAHDDLIMSLAIALQMYQICEPEITSAHYVKNNFDKWKI